MSATQELIAAALTECDLMTGMLGYEPASLRDLREACARAMVQPAAPDMAEFNKLVREFEYAAGPYGHDLRCIAARIALLDYVRGTLAERDEWQKLRDPATLHANLLRGEPARLTREMLLHLLGDAAQEVNAAPQPVGEFCTDYHCPGDCGLNGHGYQHAPQPVGAAEVPMPDIAGELFDGKRVCDEADVRTYGDLREAAGYAAGVTSGAKQVFDYIQFAAANTSDTEWDTRLCELSQDALEAVSPAAHTEWKTIQRVASESRAAGEAAGYAAGVAAGGKDAERLNFMDRNLKMRMGWSVGVALAGNVSIQSVISTRRPTSIRDAIDAALRGEVK